jgi:protein-S-isoprenylcysteine O-methyltransferase Ste14
MASLVWLPGKYLHAKHITFMQHFPDAFTYANEISIAIKPWERREDHVSAESPTKAMPPYRAFAAAIRFLMFCSIKSSIMARIFLTVSLLGGVAALPLKPIVYLKVQKIKTSYM